MRRRKSIVLAVLIVLITTMAGCRSDRSVTAIAGYPPARAALAALQGQVLATGPNGEKPAKADSVTLTPDEIAAVREKKATAAIVMHYTGDGWTNAQIAGLRQEFGNLGIEVIAVTDAGFEPDRQVSDIETVLARRPDIIVSIPADPVATAGAYQRAANAGVKLVFMDNAPKGMTAGKDYVSTVSADNFGNGVVAAHLIADALGGRGEKTIEKDYPDIKIVDRKGVTGPDFAGQAQAAATAMMVKHQDLAGIWGVWDVPTEGIVAAARSIDRTGLVVTTEDLGPIVAIAMASRQLVTGLGAQRPYDQGLTEAKLAAYALLGKPAPPYVALDALPVTRDNVLNAWREVYHDEPPPEVVESFEGARE